MIKIDREKCIGCGACVRECTMRLISIVDGKAEMNETYCMGCGHCFAVCPTGAVLIEGYENAPYEEIKNSEPLLDPEKLLSAMKQRRSIRNFTDEKVTDEQMEKILEAIKYAPTGRNTQKVELTLIEDKLPEFTLYAMEALNDLPGNLPDEVPENTKNVIKTYQSHWNRMLTEYKENGTDRLFFKAPSVLVISAKSDVDGAIAAAYAELMINALGLGCVYVGFVKIASYDKRIKEYLKIRKGYEIACTLAIGHSDVKFKRTAQRKDRKLTRL